LSNVLFSVTVAAMSDFTPFKVLSMDLHRSQKCGSVENFHHWQKYIWWVTYHIGDKYSTHVVICFPGLYNYPKLSNLNTNDVLTTNSINWH
jgi:hypothetical protein